MPLPLLLSGLITFTHTVPTAFILPIILQELVKVSAPPGSLAWGSFLYSSAPYLSLQTPAEISWQSQPSRHLIRARSQAGHWRPRNEKCMLLLLRGMHSSDRGRQLNLWSRQATELDYCTSHRGTEAIGSACGGQKGLLRGSKAWAYYWGQGQGWVFSRKEQFVPNCWKGHKIFIRIRGQGWHGDR